jgi:ATP/maltotriose-dependent transcriptional regulator MalT/DNA-binding SARP family transcriptional activator
VLAGAGFGKSTLLRAWTRERPAAWLTLGPGDRQVGTLSRHVLAALADSSSAAGQGWQAAFDRSAFEPATADGSPEDPQRAEAVAALLTEAIGRFLSAEMLLVLDDLHELGDSPAAAVIGSVIRQAEPRLHVVIASRTSPPFATQRLRARGELLELTAADLAFDLDEITSLATAALGSGSADLAAPLLHLTGGWPAAVRLAIEALRIIPPEERGREVDRLRSPSGPLFPYLAEEVFASEPLAVRELIATLAPLDEFDAALCDALGLVGAVEILDQLARRGLFVSSPRTVGMLALHDLVREYARLRLALPPARTLEVLTSAAEWHGRRGDDEGSLLIAARAGDPGLAARLLRVHGPGLVVRGRVEAVLEAAGVVPLDARDVELELIVGEAHAHRSDWADALACYQRAGGDRPKLSGALAWRLGRALYESGDPSAALAVLDRRAEGDATLRDDALWLAWRALAAWRFDRPDAVRLARRAVAVAEQSTDGSARSVAHTAASFTTMVTDQRVSSLHYRAAVSAAADAGDVIQIIRLAISGDVHLTLQDQLSEHGRAISTAEAAGNPTWLIRVLQSRGILEVDLGLYDDAVADLQRAIEVAARTGRPATDAKLFLAVVAQLRGDIAQARVAFEDGIRRAESAGEVDSAAYAKIGLARVLARVDPERARALSEASVTEGLPHHLDDYLVGAGWVGLVQGRLGDAARQAGEAMVIAAQSPGRIAALASALELQAMAATDPARRRTGLEEALGLWQSIDNAPAAAGVKLALAIERGGPEGRAAASAARRELQRAGVRPSAAEAAGLLAMLPPDQAPQLLIRTLGGFTVVRDGNPVPLREWKSKKSRDLLKMLIARRGPMTREEVGETLWPDDPAEAVSNRLSVALSLLRAVLDPGKRFPADQFVLADHDAIRLQMSELVIDLEEFTANARAGLEHMRRNESALALERLTAAEAAYAGDLFEEDVYADWAVMPREAARALYNRVGRALADLSTSAGDPDGAAAYLRRVVARDAYDEPSHLALITALARGRSHGEARRAYQAYVARMAEIEVEPAPYPASAVS